MIPHQRVVTSIAAACLWLFPAMATGQPRAAWVRTESPRFEVHYQPELQLQVQRIIGSAERAYDRISARLSFTLATKVPLVVFSPAGHVARDQVVAYAVSDDVAPQTPHRSRIVLPLPDDQRQLDELLIHELSHLLFGEIILPQASGDGGLPRWVHEGIASFMVGSRDHERLMRDLVASNAIPALSTLSGDGGFANPRVNDALGHAAFDYIASRWGASGVRRFVDALIVPRVDRTYDAVFELTPAEFDAEFRRYVRERFGSRGR